MTRRSATKPRHVILTSAFWMTGFLFVAAALSGAAHAEQQNPDGATTFGYVANSFDNTVSVIDTANNTVVATINLPVGAIPKGVATTPDGARVYVINDGNFTVSVIDTSNNTVVNTIPADDPSAVAVTPDGTHAYVTNQSEDTVSVIDIASNTVVATIPVGVFPDAVAFTPDDGPGHDDRRRQSLAYVTNSLDSTVSVIDTTNNAVVATIPVGAVPDAVAITPDGTHAYVANGFDNTFSVIDTASNAVVDTISVGGGPEDIAITPDGTRAYVANGNDNTVSVINAARNKVVATIQVGPVPTSIAITADGTRQDERDDRRHQPLAYVTNFCGLITCTNNNNTVSVIDTARNKVVATIQVGQDPIAVAFATVPH